MQRCGVKFCLHLKNYGKIAESATWNNQKSLKPLQRNGFRDFSVVLQRGFARVPFEFPQSQRGSSRGRSPPRMGSLCTSKNRTTERSSCFCWCSSGDSNPGEACRCAASFAADPLRSKNASHFGVRGSNRLKINDEGMPKGIPSSLVLQRGFEPRTPCLKGRSEISLRSSQGGLRR